MSHRVAVYMIADQDIEINGQDVWIHELRTIIVDGHGQIVDYWLKHLDSEAVPEPDGEG